MIYIIMRRHLLFTLCILSACMASTPAMAEDETFGNVYQWHAHTAFTGVDEVVILGDYVYALSANSLFSVNKKTDEIEQYTRLNGLSSAHIDHIAYNKVLNKMLIAYQNGQLDIIDQKGNIYNISDLFVKQMSVSKQANDIYMHEELAYLAMSFGVLVVDMRKMEIKDTYYIGKNSSEVHVDAITINDDVLYAITEKELYMANLSANLSDYNFWQAQPLTNAGKIQGMKAHKGNIYVVQNNQLSVLINKQWKSIKSDYVLRGICKTENHIYVLPENAHGALEVYDDFHLERALLYGYVNDVKEENNLFWLGTGDEGLVRYKDNTAQATYRPEGPNSNNSYRLRIFGNKLYMLPGGRWATQNVRMGEIMIYENGSWTNIKNGTLVEQLGNIPVYDIMNVAQDPNDSKHYFVTTFGTGMLEMQGEKVVKHYTPNNSNLIAAAPDNPALYTRTDGIMYDDKGNLWILNTGNSSTIYGTIHVVSPTGKWTSFQLYDKQNKLIRLETPEEIFMDRRNPSNKWIAIARNITGVVLLQDNGTPDNPKDDKTTFRTSWIDQNGNQITPEFIYSIAQDKNNTIWIGTSTGLFIIPPSVDFTTSNKCERIIMPRNDGTQLGDYLLDNERINAIAIDGANRIWIGTASSGLYLMDYTENKEDAEYTLETVAHFTTENSLLPSNTILSLAISPSTGEVFVGTGGGLVSYMSDATEPKEDFSTLYAYPNPVAANYYGYITIVGAMENTEVRIVDAGGNLVQTIKCTGGSAAWDGTNTQGKRVASGVYTALCNTTDGNGHGVVKILVMN